MDDYGTDDWDDPNAYGERWDEYDAFDAMDADDYREKEEANQIPAFTSKAELKKMVFDDINAKRESIRKFYAELYDLWFNDK